MKLEGTSVLRVGIDIGSKTIKAVVLNDADELAFSAYREHKGQVKKAIEVLAGELELICGDEEVTASLTGSGATSLSRAVGIPFVQEVVAARRAVNTLYPEADVAIELGGEDAKIVYLRSPIEQRMNSSCAGGTGSFLEDVASLMGVSMAELDSLAAKGEPRFNIASRCAVFAIRDLKPLLAAGNNRADVAASAYQSVVNQTLGTLACGRPVQGTVLFLGGPMEHLPALVERFRLSLKLDGGHAVKPVNAQLMPALGAALSTKTGQSRQSSFSQMGRFRQSSSSHSEGMARLPMIAKPDTAEEGLLPRATLSEATIPLYAGFDAGSTTLKLAVIDSDGRLVHSAYNASPSDMSVDARRMLAEFEGAHLIDRTIATGYGEQLLMNSVGADNIVAETAAHLRGALEVFPQASFVLDIGGQDMKALWIKNGQLDHTVVNETCSSGCGAFMSSAADTLGLELSELDDAALNADSPVDLGARCTVFMRSRVRYAQEQGASPADISAGAAHGVARNALRRLIGPKRIHTLGNFVVAQGGAFASDAVLAAFAQELGQPVHRSPLSPLMGAIGAAFIAREQAASGAVPHVEEGTPNIVAYQQYLIDNYRGVVAKGTRGHVRIGFTPATNSYEMTPFWHTLLCTLGFTVIMPADCDKEISQTDVAATLPSDTVCLPAQLAHKHCLQLACAGASHIFAPCFERAFHCSIATEYTMVLPSSMAHALGDIPILAPNLMSYSPKRMVKIPEACAALLECLNSLLTASAAITEDELEHALADGLREQKRFSTMVELATAEALDWVHAKPQRHGIVISGRSYHTSPELLNDLDTLLAEQGFAVLPPLGLNEPARAARRPLVDRELNATMEAIWRPAKHLLGFAALAVADPQLDTVCLQSFGCGMDAVSLVDVQKLLEDNGKPFTLIKLDSKADAAHTRIRLRALADAIRARKATSTEEHSGCEGADENVIATNSDASSKQPTKSYIPFEGITQPDVELASSHLPADICATATLLAAHAINEARRNPGAVIELPIPCDECLVISAQHFLMLEGLNNRIEWVSSWPRQIPEGTRPVDQLEPSENPDRLVGLVGNPLLLFDPIANQGIPELIRSRGFEPVLPSVFHWYGDMAHYAPQLDELYAAGVRNVIYLQSWACLKGHTHSRGALPQLYEKYPGMRITVLDLDLQSSELNVFNRVLLALEAEGRG